MDSAAVFSPVCLQGSFKSGDKGSRSRPSSFTGDVKPCVADSNESSTSTCSSLTPVSSVSTDSTNTSSSPPEVSPDSSEQSYAAKAKEAESAMAAMDLSSTDCDESATNASSNNVRLVDLDVSELETGDDEEHYVGAEDVPADENEEEYDNYHEVSREQGSGCFCCYCVLLLFAAAVVCCCCLLLLFAAAVCCCCLRLLFAAAVCCCCLLLLSAAVVCCCCLLLLFAAAVCCCCLLLLFAAAVCCCCLLVYWWRRTPARHSCAVTQFDLGAHRSTLFFTNQPQIAGHTSARLV